MLGDAVAENPPGLPERGSLHDAVAALEARMISVTLASCGGTNPRPCASLGFHAWGYSRNSPGLGCGRRRGRWFTALHFGDGFGFLVIGLTCAENRQLFDGDDFFWDS